ncbi:MAG: ribosome recycling factor [Armatimonadetes bacterium]|nr:ribosome recycling factor [Armatimonadota bacterium]
MTHPVLKHADEMMQKAIQATQHDFGRIRTGRANPMILDPIMVDYYGVKTPINQVATISVPEPRQLLLNPYDKSLIGEIERAIQASDLGLNPNSDGQTVRLIFPEMTEDRRRDLVKQIHHRTEEGCVSVRHARREALDLLKKMKDDNEIDEDEEKRLDKEVQTLTDKYIEATHELQKKKDEELMQI